MIFPLKKRPWLGTLAYLLAVSLQAVLVVCGYSYLIEARHVEFKLLYFLGAACLVPVFCGWVAVIVHLVMKRIRTGARLSMVTLRLVDIAVLTALIATVCYRGYRAVLYRITDGVAQHRVSATREILLPFVEGDIRSFYKLFGRIPSDLRELEAELRGTSDLVASAYYIDPCSDLCGGSAVPLHYVRVDDNTVLIYSVGPDCDDDKGKKEFTEDLFRYHWSYRPWHCMPFGMVLYKVSGLSDKFDGDITTVISNPGTSVIHGTERHP